MGFNAHASKQNAHFCDCFHHVLAELKGFLSAVPKIQMHSERGRDGAWKARRQRHNLFTIKYLQFAWGSEFTMQTRRQKESQQSYQT